MKRPVAHIALFVYLSVVALVIILPLVYVLFGSIRPTPAITGTLWDLLPTGFTWDHFRSAFDRAPLLRQMLNSAVVVVAQTGFQVLTSVLAAYAIVFGRFRRPGLILGMYLVTMMIPNEATVVANYLTIASSDSSTPSSRYSSPSWHRRTRSSCCGRRS